VLSAFDGPLTGRRAAGVQPLEHDMKKDARDGRRRRSRPPVAGAAIGLLVALPLLAGAAVPEEPDGQADPIAVHLAGIRIVGEDQALLILADEEERRAVPIAVGKDQGLAIYLGQEKTPTPRPMTHDLMVQILETLEVKVEQVLVTELRDGTYFSEIAIRNGRKRHRIDARPSDAIALAVRLDVPILASPDLLVPIEGESEPPADVAEGGRRFGITVQDLDADLAEYLGATGVPGVMVASVADDSPAGTAGLLRGDILQRLDGRSTATLAEFREAAEMASEHPTFDVWRDGEKLTLVRRP
jgi:bifunctional DNase/RNase